MKVSIFGLGYVGAVSAGCLARSGHQIIGVDPVATKVDHINAGESPIIEEGIGELIAEVVGSGQLRAVQDAAEAVAQTEISIVCVGTPSSPNGKLDLSYLAGVSQDIGTALAQKDGEHLIIVRSTVLPGTVEGLVLPILETATGRKHGDRYRVVYNPEFLREGTSISDFFGPPMTLIGTLDDEPVEVVRELYSAIDAPFNVVPARVAEMMKASALRREAAPAVVRASEVCPSDLPSLASRPRCARRVRRSARRSVLGRSTRTVPVPVPYSCCTDVYSTTQGIARWLSAFATFDSLKRKPERRDIFLYYGRTLKGTRRVACAISLRNKTTSRCH